MLIFMISLFLIFDTLIRHYYYVNKGEIIMKGKTINKKVVIGIGICLIVIMVIMFMKQSRLKLKSTDFTIEYGQNISMNVGDYLDIDHDKNKEMILSKAQLKVNIPNENHKDYPAVGEYPASIIFENDKFDFKIYVKDTTPPQFKTFKNICETPLNVKPQYGQIYTADDLSKVTITCDEDNIKYDSIGEYKTIIKAIDEYQNETTKELTVKVTQPITKCKQKNLYMQINTTALLEVEVKGKDKPIFQTNDSNIITVDENGKITAKNAGKGTITVSANGQVDRCQVNVQPIKNSDYVKIKDFIPNIFIDLRYASSNNFTGQVIYSFKDAYLRYGTVQKLMKVQNDLQSKGYSLKIWDAYRPFSAQKKLWQVVSDSRYVANPSKGPRTHNLGYTVDITMVKKDGTEIPMPTQFDEFSKKADRDYQDIHNSEAVNNVRLLEKTMYQYGFVGYQNEWWDYSDTNTYSYVDFQPE